MSKRVNVLLPQKLFHIFKISCLPTICITRAKILSHFLYLTVRKLSVCPLSPLLRGENGQKFICSSFISVLTKSIDFFRKWLHSPVILAGIFFCEKSVIVIVIEQAFLKFIQTFEKITCLCIYISYFLLCYKVPSSGVTMGLGGENGPKWIFTVLVITQDPDKIFYKLWCRFVRDFFRIIWWKN